MICCESASKFSNSGYTQAKVGHIVKRRPKFTAGMVVFLLSAITRYWYLAEPKNVWYVGVLLRMLGWRFFQYLEILAAIFVFNCHGSPVDQQPSQEHSRN